MKYIHLPLIFVALAFFTTANSQQTFRATTTTTIGFLEYVPKDYSQNSDKYPVVIFLHGLGEKGPASTNLTILEQGIGPVTKNGPPKLVKNGTQFPFILISPQLKSNYGNWESWYVMEVINYCKTYLRIDERRIYLTGLSLGGGGTWWTAQDFPKQFAAIAPVCGSRNSTSKACLLATENLPVWAFHGDKDTTVPMSRTVNMINAINNCSPVPSPLAKITIYPGVGHNAWDNAYKADHTLHNPNVYEWMLSFQNNVNGSNKLPIANAGSDIVQALPVNSVTIKGSATDDGKIASINWTQLDGPSQALLTNATTSTLKASNLVVGVYMFQMKVTDDGGDVDSDFVKVTIADAPSTINSPPITSAGPDRLIKLPTVSNTLFGSAYDPDGKILSYHWVKVSGPACTLSSSSVSRPKISNLVSGVYTFRLTSFDNNGASSFDDVVITTDLPPVVNAGSDKLITLPSNSIVLKGTASDPDGKIVSYIWSKDSGPAVTLLNKTTSSVTVSKLLEGTYVFKMSVKDDTGATSVDYATVIVLPSLNGRDSTDTDNLYSSSAKFMLADSENPDLVGSKLIVYDESGYKIYEGDWSANLYSKVFNRKGLYIFHLLTKGRRKTGKVYVLED